jgi:hypothetical protein
MYMVDRQWNWRQNRALEKRLRDARLQGPACIEDIDFRATRGLDKQVDFGILKWPSLAFCFGPGIESGKKKRSSVQRGPHCRHSRERQRSKKSARRKTAGTLVILKEWHWPTR